MSAEPTKRVYRPRQLVMHVTEQTYAWVDEWAKIRGTTKAAILREIMNAGVKALQEDGAP